MSDRPNIMLLIGEDTGRLLGCYGDPIARTPHLDRLAEQGVRFDRAFGTCPVCAPSRSSIVTGQYPTKIGTHHMRSRLLHPPRLFTHELCDAGYWVNWSGKTDFNFEPGAGWRSDGEPWLDRLRAGRMQDSPWFVYMNLAITHESCMWPDAPVVAGRPENQFSRGRPRPPRVTNPATVPVPPYLPDTPAVREDIARHYDNIAALDQELGEVMAALEASGQGEKTIVMFLADHGRGLPREKRWCYPAGLHLPLVVRWPAGLGAGGVDDRLVSWVDIAATVLSLGGVEIPGDYDGQIFLGPAAAAPRECVFAGRDRMDEAYDLVRVVVRGDWLYVRNFWTQLPYAQRNTYMEYMPSMQALRRLHASGQLHGERAVFMRCPKPAEELYDLRADPHCVRNLAGEGRFGEQCRSLKARLDRWMEQTGDLGLVPERSLIERGLVADHLGEYAARIEPLPGAYRIGPERGALEMSEAAVLERAAGAVGP